MTKACYGGFGLRVWLFRASGFGVQLRSWVQFREFDLQGKGALAIVGLSLG